MNIGQLLYAQLTLTTITPIFQTATQERLLSLLKVTANKLCVFLCIQKFKENMFQIIFLTELSYI